MTFTQESKGTVFCGTQKDVAAHIEMLLYGRTTAAGTKGILDFMLTQRIIRKFTNLSNVFAWRGIGIDVTPRSCACWIDDPVLLQRWQAPSGK